jgi:hypothetical protein
VYTLFLLCYGPTRALSSSLMRFLYHTQRRTTFGKTPLDEWTARRRNLYLTTHNTHSRKASMPRRNSNPHSQQTGGRKLRLTRRGHWYRLRAYIDLWTYKHIPTHKIYIRTYIHKTHTHTYICTRVHTHISIKVKFTLEQVTKVLKGSRVINYSFFNLGGRWGWWSTPHPGRFTPKEKPVPVVWEAGWVPGLVWMVEENVAPTGIRSPNLPPLASPYIDWATPVHSVHTYVNLHIYLHICIRLEHSLSRVVTRSLEKMVLDFVESVVR